MQAPSDYYSSIDYDALEQGLLKEYPTELLQATSQNGKFKTCIICIDDDKKTCVLYDGDTRKFLLQGIYDENELNWLIYQYQEVEDDLDNMNLPFCCLRQNLNGNYVLWNRDCQQCDTYHNYKCSHNDSGYREQLIHVQTYTKDVEDSYFNLLRAVIPSLDKNKQRWSWCPRNYPERLSYNNMEFSFKSTNKRIIQSGEFLKDKESVYLQSIEPLYDPKTKSFAVDFQRTGLKQSKRNFQIHHCDDDNQEDVIVQCGKLKSKTFVLDFKFPLSIVQAFSLALVSFSWK